MQRIKGLQRGRIKSGDSRGEILFGYSVSYIIIITVLFVLIGGYSYSYIVRDSRDRAKAELGYTVRKYKDNLDSNLSNSLNIATSFYSNQEIARLRKLSGRFSPAEHLKFQELSRVLSPYVTNSDFLDRVTLYFHSNQVFIASDMVESRPQVYYNIRGPGEQATYAQWRQEQIGKEPGRFYVPESSHGGIVNLYYRLPFHDSATGVTVITTLQVGNMLESFGLTDTYQRAAMIVTDNEGKVLYAGGRMADTLQELVVTNPYDAKVTLDGIRYQWYREESSFMDWSIHFLVDQRELYTSDLQGKLLAVYFSVLAVAVLLAVLFAKNTSDPVASILRLFDGEDRKASGESRDEAKVWQIMNGNELRYVWRRVSDMSESNTRLTRQIKDYSEASREVFFNKLLSGDAMLPEEITMAQKRDGALFEYTCFTVAVIRFLMLDSAADDEEKRYWAVSAAVQAAAEKLEARKDEGIFYSKIACDQIAVILCGDRERGREETIAPISPLGKEIYLQTGVNARGGVGTTVHNIDQIFISYQNAAHVLYNMDVLDKEIFVWYDSREKRQAKVDYGIEDEQRLLNAMSQGNAETAKKMILEIVERNRAELYSSKIQRSHFVSAFTETAYRLESQISDIGEEQEKELRLYLWQMKNVQEPDLIMSYLTMVVDLFCGIIAKRSENRYQKLMNRITEHIEERYGDPDLCLTSIAACFRLTESYISTFFKQNSGSNISQHIERVRMTHAAELLLNTELNTTAVAEQVGYGNMNTFYKAFKRYFGVNPKAFRARGGEQGGEEPAAARETVAEAE